MSYLWWIFWCLVWILFSVCAYRAAWSSWAEVPTTGAAVTHLQVVNQRPLIKPCSPRYLLLVDFISSIWYEAPVRLSFSMTSNCFVLTSWKSKLLSCSLYKQCSQGCWFPASAIQPYTSTATLSDRDSAWDTQLHLGRKCALFY